MWLLRMCLCFSPGRSWDYLIKHRDSSQCSAFYTLLYSHPGWGSMYSSFLGCALLFFFSPRGCHFLFIAGPWALLFSFILSHISSGYQSSAVCTVFSTPCASAAPNPCQLGFQGRKSCGRPSGYYPAWPLPACMALSTFMTPLCSRFCPLPLTDISFDLPVLWIVLMVTACGTHWVVPARHLWCSFCNN